MVEPSLVPGLGKRLMSSLKQENTLNAAAVIEVVESNQLYYLADRYKMSRTY